MHDSSPEHHPELSEEQLESQPTLEDAMQKLAETIKEFDAHSEGVAVVHEVKVEVTEAAKAEVDSKTQPSVSGKQNQNPIPCCHQHVRTYLMKGCVIVVKYFAFKRVLFKK